MERKNIIINDDKVIINREINKETVDPEHHLAGLDRFRWVRNVNGKLLRTSLPSPSPSSLMHFFQIFFFFVFILIHHCKHLTPE